PLDRAWLLRLLDADRRQPPPEPSAPAAGAPASDPAPSTLRRQSWGEAPDVSGFLGRSAEREQLRRWVADEHVRVVVVQGRGGFGKAMLVSRLAHDLAPEFDRVVWRSLTNAPPPAAWLADVIGYLAPDQPATAGSEAAQVRRLLELLAEARCLLVLDN